MKRQGKMIQRSGTTSTEVLVSTVLLGIAAVGIGAFSGTMRRGLRNQELNMLLHWELDNTCAQVAAWDYDTVTENQIEQIRMSNALQQRMPDARWEAAVQEIDEPLVAKQVTLELAAIYQGQKTRPVSLTFWIPKVRGREVQQ